MSQPVVGADYVTCELVAATNASVTTLLVSTPTEAFPTLGVGEYFYLTLIDEASYAIDANPPVQREIVKVTDYDTVSTGFSLTVVRGITTTAQIWASGAICEIRPCEQWFEDLKSNEGSTWAITDGITTVTDVENLFIAGGVVSDLGANAAGVTTAPPGASYLTLGTNTTLTNERVLTAGTNITFTDGGAGSTLTINASGGGGGSGSLRGQEFTSSGTFNVPSTVSSVWVTMIGGGGGGSALAGAANGGGGGGSGEYRESVPVFCTASGTITVTIGAAGAGTTGAGNGTAGGTTSVNNGTLTYSAAGGGGGNGTTRAGGVGGGINGGASGGGSGGAGILGTVESADGFGGASGGGGGNTTATAGGAGGANVGFPTPVSGGAVVSTQAGGGAGGSSPFGLGGAGGDGGSSGSSPISTAYGAGGGGAGGKVAAANGAAGVKGYVLIQWVE